LYLCGVVKRKILSLVGMLLSIVGFIGVILSTVMSIMLISVITVLSGLFTLAVRSNDL